MSDQVQRTEERLHIAMQKPGGAFCQACGCERGSGAWTEPCDSTYEDEVRLKEGLRAVGVAAERKRLVAVLRRLSPDVSVWISGLNREPGRALTLGQFADDIEAGRL